MKAEIEAALAQHGATATFFETCEEETARPIAARAIEAGSTLIIAAGGDGTVMETINAAMGTQTVIGIVPAGTGNLMAANLNIPLTVEEAVATALTGVVKKIDLVSIDGGDRYFAIMGGLGYDAVIMRNTPRIVKQKLGKLAYAVTAIREMRGMRFSVQLLLDDERRIRTHAKMVLIANMGEVVKGVRLFPDADPGDGAFEVGILKSGGVRSILTTIWHIARGKPADSPYFDRYTARKLILRTRKPVPYELDGDDLGDENVLMAEIAPHAARIMVSAA